MSSISFRGAGLEETHLYSKLGVNRHGTVTYLDITVDGEKRLLITKAMCRLRRLLFSDNLWHYLQTT